MISSVPWWVEDGFVLVMLCYFTTALCIRFRRD